jgi:uncharacterized protein
MKPAPPASGGAGFVNGMHRDRNFDVFPVEMRYDFNGMIPLIEQHRHQIAELCRRCGVKRLELFGSAASGDFDPVRSDVDFLYEFHPSAADDVADRFFAFKEHLEALLQRKVDLVSARHATNPYFLQEANRHRQTLYAA